MASMDVVDVMRQQLVAAAPHDLLARISSGELETDAKRQKLLSDYGEELERKYLEWVNLQVWLRGPERTETFKLTPLNHYEPRTRVPF